MSSVASFRIEKDLLGSLEVPRDAYYGIQTLRALHNFRLTGVPLSHYPKLVVALAMVKQAAADANRELGYLPPAKHAAIGEACGRIAAGEFHDQFVVDMIQGGAGTSTNMNANEVIANVGLEHLGHARGEYGFLHPNNDVNMAQSTNDATPPPSASACCSATTPCWPAWSASARRWRPRARPSPGCSRWAAPSCRTPCR